MWNHEITDFNTGGHRYVQLRFPTGSDSSRVTLGDMPANYLRALIETVGTFYILVGQQSAISARRVK